MREAVTKFDRQKSCWPSLSTTLRLRFLACANRPASVEESWPALEAVFGLVAWLAQPAPRIAVNRISADKVAGITVSPFIRVCAILADTRRTPIKKPPSSRRLKYVKP